MNNPDKHFYADTLLQKEAPAWKKLLNVQLPYKLHIQNLKLGRTLDIGCGLGRNLAYLSSESVGIDPDSKARETATARGFRCFAPNEFHQSFKPEQFDSLLCSHVLEHLSPDDGHKLISEYLKYIKPKGKIVFICPQLAGFKSDSDHKYFHSADSLSSMMRALQLSLDTSYSFPFPQAIGTFFKHNETVVIGRK